MENGGMSLMVRGYRRRSRSSRKGLFYDRWAIPTSSPVEP